MRLVSFLRLLKTLAVDREPDLARIEATGLLAVKLGQIFALRPDFFGVERCRHLARLYSRASAMPSVALGPLLAAATGDEFRQEVVDLEPVPFAAASIGQVHRARLRTGERVAVKLVKPNDAERFRRDAEDVRRYLRWAIRFYPRLSGVANPVTLVDELEAMTLAELDLRNEVAGSHLLEELAMEHGRALRLDGFRFRHIHEPLSGERVLVSELVEAPSLDALMDERRLGYAELLELFRLHGSFLFALGIFHGDLHPGNVLREPEGFVLLDTGVVGRATERVRRGLFRFFQALAYDELPQAAARLAEVSSQPLEGRRREKFEREFLELYRDFAGKTVAEVSLTQQMMRTVRMGVVAGMDFGTEVFDIIKSLMFLDGMVLRTNPQAVLLRDMRPILDDFERLVVPQQGIGAN